MDNRINVDAPHFKRGKEAQKACLEGAHFFIPFLLDADQLEYVAKEVNGAQEIEIFFKVINHFKDLSIKCRIFDKQIGDGRFYVKIQNLHPPGAVDLIFRHSNEGLQSWAGKVGRATEVSINYFLCLNPRCFVCYFLDAKIGRFIFNEENRRVLEGRVRGGVFKNGFNSGVRADIELGEWDWSRSPRSNRSNQLNVKGRVSRSDPPIEMESLQNVPPFWCVK